jgi:hypothetical protein
MATPRRLSVGVPPSGLAAAFNRHLPAAWGTASDSSQWLLHYYAEVRRLVQMPLNPWGKPRGE